MTRRPAPLRAGLATLVGVVCLALAACSSEPTSEPGPTSKPRATRAAADVPSTPATLTYGVFGSEEEIAAYQEVVDAYNARSTTVDVTLRSWPTSEAMLRAIAGGEAPPDLYQISRDELAGVIEEGRNVPLFSLLEERDVSYGDTLPRTTIEAFSVGNDLQCMPYGISPTVMYVNTDLVNFNRMRARGLPAPPPDLGGWDFEMFQAAAEYATRPRLHTRGVSIAPTLAAMAPFLYSGGGTLVDDETDPTSLDLSSDDNRETLDTLLTLARNPLITLTDTQLRKASPQEWFERGRLGLLEGDRSLVPDLRAAPDLTFDVMPMPRVSHTATTATVTGVCISPGPEVQKAADFLVHLISPEGFAPVAEAGYVVPANTAVARSAVFLQAGQQPANSGVFNASIDAMHLLPLVIGEPELTSAVGPLIKQLFTVTLPPDIEAATELIDETSRSVLDPDYVEPPVPTGPPSLPVELPTELPAESAD